LTSWYSSTSTASNRPRRAGQRRPPQQQQVVEVDEGVPALVRDVAAEQPGKLPGELAAPGEALRHHLGDRGLGVHAPGVDVGADLGPRCPPLDAHQVVVGAQRIEHIRHVGRVDHAERGRQRERLGVRPDDPVRDRVKRAAADPVTRARMPLRDPCQHVVGRAAGERQQQDPAGLDALRTQPGGPGHQGPGLAGPGAGQHQQRPARVRRGLALLIVQFFENTGRFEHAHECSQPE
jgi:hypothetical protein